MLLQAYKVKNNPNKMLRIIKDDLGWYYIYNVPRDRNNIFSSIEELEVVINFELEKPAFWIKEI